MSKISLMIGGVTELLSSAIGWRNKCESTRRLDGQVVVITGANTGIGKETALHLSLRGAKIIIACRDVDKGKEAITEILVKNPNANLNVLKLDLSSLASVREFAKNVSLNESNIDILINNAGLGMCPEWQTKEGYEMVFGTNHLDILINNAGLGMCPEWQTKEGYEMVFGTNHLGHFLLTLLLLPLLRKSPKARVINVSSVAYKMGKIDFENINLRNGVYNGITAYSQSKLANILFSRELSKRLGPNSPVTTYSLHPGPVKTNRSRYMENKSLKAFYDTMTTLLYLRPEMGCQTTLYCALEESLDRETGLYYNNCREEKLWANGSDDKSAERLWNLSCDLVHLEDHLKI
ncbi:unnamed protein product [Oppiella nova]|uniref:Uncharacterized protein n=1 Tax=Oppiella nova TaxID=334625 RepID=A0A7R9M482_9ACAR|nr:unnamed protein product [Oppiella nova]CAG2169959.1 unnamed protein product [Oppiella nova]